MASSLALERTPVTKRDDFCIKEIIVADKKHFLAEIEENLLKTWEDEKTFEQSLENRKDAQRFTFYDGPPFANGVPHYGHLVQTTIKDAVTRYKTMKGYYVPRRVGWDTHGLPVEYAIEKKHGFKGKRDIVEYGIDKFNAECRESVFEFKDIWENMFRRVGRWADYKSTYATLDESYIESVWWVFKSLYDKGYVYKDFRSSPYCPRCATPLSNFELNQGYQDGVKDPSLFVKFKLKDEDAYLLGWTTTPWSLPGNAAIAVNPDAEYVYVRLKDDEGREEVLILARARLEVLNVDTYHIEKELRGRDLIGKSYEPLFELNNLPETVDNTKLYKVWDADFVSIEDGSGVLHVAPAFGEDDLSLGKEKEIGILITVDENGHIVTDQGLPEEFTGKFFKSADMPIIEYLAKRGMVYAAETFTHTYPFCWRCDTPLLYYATDSWLVSVNKIKGQLVVNNQKINWTPKHIRDGRFGKWLENARDWAISRNRFWGAPLPIWVTDDGEVTVIGSMEELKKRAINPDKVGDLHRPFVDDIEIKTDSGKTAKRIPEVFDCWFESGSMPYAQDHYPFENKGQWESNFPADFIAEAIDQTRGWFYTLHVLASALFDKPAFDNVVCSGWVVAADGEKLSKRKKNYAPMDEVFDQYGVDSMRYFMAGSPIVNGEDVRFSVDYLRDVQRNVFMTFNNIFSFYKLYADVDKWKPKNPMEEPKSTNVLDQWMLARLNQAILEVTEGMEEYRLDRAARPIAELLDDISNWYVRRSRRRFWKTEDDADKEQAYETLHYVILRTAQLLAPFSPFLPDYIWRQMVQGTNLPNSVHLTDWPSVSKPDKASQKLLEEMKKARSFIVEGLAQRAAAGIKVRQPLSSVTIPKVPEELKQIIADELNIKKVIVSSGEGGNTINLDINVSSELKEEGIARELVRVVQNARKSAGFNVDDRIKLRIISSSNEITKAYDKFKELISAETLAEGILEANSQAEYSTSVKVEGCETGIYLSRAH
jgi:isoleucyl-tRNA synthetase